MSDVKWQEKLNTSNENSRPDISFADISKIDASVVKDASVLRDRINQNISLESIQELSPTINNKQSSL